MNASSTDYGSKTNKSHALSRVASECVTVLILQLTKADIYLKFTTPR